MFIYICLCFLLTNLFHFFSFYLYLLVYFQLSFVNVVNAFSNVINRLLFLTSVLFCFHLFRLFWPGVVKQPQHFRPVDNKIPLHKWNSFYFSSINYIWHQFGTFPVFRIHNWMSFVCLISLVFKICSLFISAME